MAILTIISSLNTVENSFISLLFPNQCLVCKEGATPLEKKNDTYAESV